MRFIFEKGDRLIVNNVLVQTVYQVINSSRAPLAVDRCRESRSGRSNRGSELNKASWPFGPSYRCRQVPFVPNQDSNMYDGDSPFGSRTGIAPFVACRIRPRRR